MNETIMNVTSKSLMYVNTIVTKIIVGIIIFIVGLILARIVSKLAEKLLRDFSLDSAVRKKTGVKTSFEKFLSGGISLVISLIFLVIALNYIGITTLIVNVLSIAIIIIITASLLLTIKDSVPNIIAYRAIRSKDLVRVGDKIIMDNTQGVVEDLNLFQVKIAYKEDVLFIPNALFLHKEFKRRHRKKK